MNWCFLIVLCVIFDRLNTTSGYIVPISPCPKIFHYRFDDNQWYGLMVVKNPGTFSLLEVKVTLSMIGKQTTISPGEIKLLTRGQLEKDVPIWYKVIFPNSNYPPKLVQVSVNGRIICIGAPDQGMFVTQFNLEHIRKFTFIRDDMQSTAIGLNEVSDEGESDVVFEEKNMPFSNKNLEETSKDVICGRTNSKINFHVSSLKNKPTIRVKPDSQVLVVTSDELLNNNEQPHLLARGGWPWLAAVYVNNLTSLTYQCGGSLISSRIVVSAAHCFHIFEKRYTPNEVLIFLGRHNLKNWNEEGSLAAPIDNIFIHPDYDSQLNSYDADVAVVILRNKVRFNAFIRPACLWSSSTNLEYIEGEQGVVVGWGLGGNLDKMTSTIPKAIQVPIVSNKECFFHDDNFRNISSNRTFCAGNVERNTSADTVTNQSKVSNGPCEGDSGAGLLIYKNNRWNLRGIVSASIPNARKDGELKKTSCSTNQYVIYTDVAKFLDWIFSFTL